MGGSEQVPNIRVPREAVEMADKAFGGSRSRGKGSMTTPGPMPDEADVLHRLSLLNRYLPSGFSLRWHWGYCSDARFRV